MANKFVHIHINYLDAWTARTGNRDRHPKLCGAIDELVNARDDEMQPQLMRKRLRRLAATGASAHHKTLRRATAKEVSAATGAAKELNRLRVNSCRLRKKIKELNADVAAARSSKDLDRVERWTTH